MTKYSSGNQRLRNHGFGFAFLALLFFSASCAATTSQSDLTSQQLMAYNQIQASKSQLKKKRVDNASTYLGSVESAGDALSGLGLTKQERVADMGAVLRTAWRTPPKLRKNGDQNAFNRAVRNEVAQALAESSGNWALTELAGLYQIAQGDEKITLRNAMVSAMIRRDGQIGVDAVSRDTLANALAAYRLNNPTRTNISKAEQRLITLDTVLSQLEKPAPAHLPYWSNALAVLIADKPKPTIAADDTAALQAETRLIAGVSTALNAADLSPSSKRVLLDTLARRAPAKLLSSDPRMAASSSGAVQRTCVALKVLGIQTAENAQRDLSDTLIAGLSESESDVDAVELTVHCAAVGATVREILDAGMADRALSARHKAAIALALSGHAQERSVDSLKAEQRFIERDLAEVSFHLQEAYLALATPQMIAALPDETARALGRFYRRVDDETAFPTQTFVATFSAAIRASDSASDTTTASVLGGLVRRDALGSLPAIEAALAGQGDALVDRVSRAVSAAIRDTDANETALVLGLFSNALADANTQLSSDDFDELSRLYGRALSADMPREANYYIASAGLELFGKDKAASDQLKQSLYRVLEEATESDRNFVRPGEIPPVTFGERPDPSSRTLSWAFKGGIFDNAAPSLDLADLLSNELGHTPPEKQNLKLKPLEFGNIATATAIWKTPLNLQVNRARGPHLSSVLLFDEQGRMSYTPDWSENWSDITVQKTKFGISSSLAKGRLDKAGVVTFLELDALRAAREEMQIQLTYDDVVITEAVSLSPDFAVPDGLVLKQAGKSGTNGKAGSTGRKGKNGSDGNEGYAAQTVGGRGNAGRNGGRGNSGEDGQAGTRGSNGTSATSTILVAKPLNDVVGNERLLLLTVLPSGRNYVINDETPISFDGRGGKGGIGGAGGSGGAGGKGGRGGPGGYGGQGYFGGQGPQGGYCTSAYCNCNGGQGGPGGAGGKGGPGGLGGNGGNGGDGSVGGRGGDGGDGANLCVLFDGARSELVALEGRLSANLSGGAGGAGGKGGSAGYGGAAGSGGRGGYGGAGGAGGMGGMAGSGTISSGYGYSTPMFCMPGIPGMRGPVGLSGENGSSGSNGKRGQAGRNGGTGNNGQDGSLTTQSIAGISQATTIAQLNAACAAQN